MTEAAEKVGLKPETFLAHAMHIAGADAVIERHCLMSDGCAERNAQTPKGARHRGARFPPLDPGLRPWSLSREIVPRPARDAAAGPCASPRVLLPPGSGHSRTRVNPRPLARVPPRSRFPGLRPVYSRTEPALPGCRPRGCGTATNLR